jgi:hypothetical protein
VAFRFRHLAAAVGRLPLGGQRETALGTLLAARCVAGAFADEAPATARAPRADNARQWVQSLVIDPAARAALVALVTASGDGGSPAGATRALARVMEVTAGLLDRGARSELAALARDLAR